MRLPYPHHKFQGIALFQDQELSFNIQMLGVFTREWNIVPKNDSRFTASVHSEFKFHVQVVL